MERDALKFKADTLSIHTLYGSGNLHFDGGGGGGDGMCSTSSPQMSFP